MHTDLGREPSVAPLLHALPQEAAPPFGWEEFRRRSLPRPTRATHLTWAPALAAGLVLAVALCALAIRVAGLPRHPRTTVPEALQYGLARLPSREPPVADETSAERYLESLPREPSLVHVGTRAAVETLEDNIAQVDDLVSAARAGRAPPARLQALLDDRTQLVSSLVQVRYAESLAAASR
ncbi:MAG TPA: hypothetical protein VNX02_13840 [Steroidobacteraceae bacterium]|jgi:hypothetical protein|nr:hypothetical protein [Steroidobacteraceae bacterium]